MFECALGCNLQGGRDDDGVPCDDEMMMAPFAVFNFVGLCCRVIRGCTYRRGVLFL